MNTLSYIKNFTKDAKVAAIAPTSSFGVKRVLAKIDFRTPLQLIEYGPGDGVITRALVNELPPESELYLIERNKEFVRMLRQQFDGGNIKVLHRGAEEVLGILREVGIDSVDYIVSGIPFTLLKRRIREQIIRDSYAALAPGGRFIAYQTFWQPNEHLYDYLGRHFSHVTTEFELLNAPPLRIYEAQKEPVTPPANGLPRRKRRHGRVS